MYIAVQVDQFDSTQIALVLDNCWATPVNQMDYSIRWDLIVNKCPKPSDGSVSVLQNGVSTSSRFSFSMFTFANFSPKIYLHCQVHLCLQKTGNCTLMQQGNNKRYNNSTTRYYNYSTTSAINNTRHGNNNSTSSYNDNSINNHTRYYNYSTTSINNNTR
ncbi:hypothetical protein KOW79_011718 [Hemibagrus wyckioides]|uniref:ZP domain-containing protein n=1 Tax=Hemibagrus wyckioides TaxID=337641 RepID=A0A9D3SII3_9TELE|nr:hypothetical protein KOW79_011718 [Hemibagrus wyckioides]